jgi:hypothetical protein
VQHKANMEQSEGHFQAHEQSNAAKAAFCVGDMAKSVIVQFVSQLAINKWAK